MLFVTQRLYEPVILFIIATFKQPYELADSPNAVVFQPFLRLQVLVWSVNDW